MKPLRVIILSLLFMSVLSAHAADDQKTAPEKDAVQLWASPELKELVLAWIEDYNATHPGKEVQFDASSESGRELFKSSSSVLVMTDKTLNRLPEDPKWRITVGRDVIVPIMNAGNPLRDKIAKCGLSPSDFSMIYTSKGQVRWTSFLDQADEVYINACLPEDGSCMNYLCCFLNKEANQIICRKTGSHKETIARVAKDKNAIAFCRLRDLEAFEAEGNDRMISLIPIDLDNNNDIGPFENIYSDHYELIRGIWIGKYPRELFTRIYAITKEQPSNDEQIAFLQWLMSEGQQHLERTGYVGLTYSESQSGISRLKASAIPLTQIPTATSSDNTVLIVVAAIILVAALLIVLFIGAFRRPSKDDDGLHAGEDNIFNENSLKVPGGVFFDRTHTWTFMEPEGFVRTGVDDFLPKVTGTITKIKMKKPGENVKKGEVFLTIIRDGKRLNIYSPVSGTIREINPLLQKNSSLINDDPFSEGWVYKIEAASWLKEMKGYFMADAYREWIRDEFARLKDFLAKALRPEEKADIQPVLQEGGELWKGILEDSDPDVWEEFQTGFINKSFRKN